MRFFRVLKQHQNFIVNPNKSLEKRNKLARASHLYIYLPYSRNKDVRCRPFDVWGERGMDDLRKKSILQIDFGGGGGG